MKLKLPERRRYVRIEAPLKVKLASGGKSYEVTSKDISPVGVRLEIGEKLKEAEGLSLSVSLPDVAKPVRIKGKLVWQAKTSLEDKAPYDVGVEIVEVDDKDKSSFLKYVCDVLYISAEYRPRE
ncbi:MAG: PilZ domain-containing protein [Candidatus Omnitrophota bacterium]